jgi:hypothetical protein
MINKKEWSEFRETGLLLIINQILHIFGWVIVFETDENDNVLSVYPARTSFRGFSHEQTTEAYKKVSGYMANNATQLKKEASSD